MNAEGEFVILVVDDKVVSLKLLLDILRDTDYEVLFVKDGITALEFAEREQPDLILLDIILPKLNGYQVFERLKESERTKNIPVIFMSGMSQTVDKVKGFDLGAVDYITKPFDCDEVMARIRAHLRVHKGLHNNKSTPDV